MKARTHSKKLKAKRGRPKIEVVYREPNGRASRALNPPDRLALEARAKMLGISLVQAKNPESIDYLGRLKLAHEAWQQRARDKSRPSESISPEQYHAAIQLREIANDYSKAIGSPGAIYDPSIRGSGDDEAHAYWCDKARQRRSHYWQVIQDAQNETRAENLFAALDHVVIRGGCFPHMVNAVRTLCNAVVRHNEKPR